jgi:hypothetical protein
VFAFRRLILFLVVMTTAVTWTRSARAEPLVVILGTDDTPPRPGLVEALQIQLTTSAAVKTGPHVTGSLPLKLEQATAALKASRATIVVWVETAEETQTEGEELVLYMVGQKRDRALIEVARLPSSDPPSVDRALALKIREVLESVLSEPPPQNLARQIGGRAQRQRGAPSTPKERPGPALRLLAELGIVVATDPQVGGSFGVGGQVEIAPWLVEASLDGYVASDLKASGPEGRVIADERGVVGGLHVLHALGPAAIGASLYGGARLLDLEGFSSDGRYGSAARTIPILRLAPELRVAVLERLHLCARVGLEAALTREQFTIEGAPIFHLGRARGFGNLSLLFSVP